MRKAVVSSAEFGFQACSVEMHLYTSLASLQLDRIQRHESCLENATLSILHMYGDLWNPNRSMAYAPE